MQGQPWLLLQGEVCLSKCTVHSLVLAQHGMKSMSTACTPRMGTASAHLRGLCLPPASSCPPGFGGCPLADSLAVMGLPQKRFRPGCRTPMLDDKVCRPALEIWSIECALACSAHGLPAEIQRKASEASQHGFITHQIIASSELCLLQAPSMIPPNNS